MIHHLDDQYASDAEYDFDGDNLSNRQEFQKGSDPHNPDTDGDGAPDGDDFAPSNANYRIDADNDGMPEAWEMIYGFYDADPLDASFDFDNDGLSNLQEFLAGTHPYEADTDHDGVFDGQDFAPTNAAYSHDEDHDGMPGEWEQQYTSLADYYASDAMQDQDGDRLTNLQEFLAGTNPENPDSDGDGFPDGDDMAPLNPAYGFDYDRDGLPMEWEMRYGFNDNDRLDALSDADGDSLLNFQEFELGTDP